LSQPEDNVLIDIVDKHFSPDGDEGGAHVRVTGRLDTDPADETHWFLRYTEHIDPTGICETEIDARPGSVLISRRGDRSMLARVEPHVRQVCMFTTRLGQLRMGITGTEIKPEYHPDSRRLFVKYLIDVRGEIISLNSMDFQIRPLSAQSTASEPSLDIHP